MHSYIKEATFNEIVKLIKNKTNYIYIIVILSAVIASFLGARVIGDSDNSFTGYSYILFSLQTLSTTMLPFMLLLFASNMISSEKTSGTIRNILASGCTKAQFLISKILVSFIFQLALMVIALLSTVIISFMLFGFGNLTEDGFMIMSQYQFWAQFFTAYVLLAIVLFAVISFGLMISTIVQNNVSAITTAIGVYILLEGIKTKLHIENFVYTSYIDFPLRIISERTEGFPLSWTPTLYYYLLVSMLWIFLSIFISFLVIRRLEFK